MRRLPILLLALTVACSPATSPSPSPSAETVPTYTGLGLEALSAYNATFEMSFAGAPDWSYHLETRTDGHAVEYRLHLEGLSNGSKTTSYYGIIPSYCSRGEYDVGKDRPSM